MAQNNGHGDWIPAASGALLGVAISFWTGLGPLLQALLVLMGADIVTGVIAAAIAAEVSSATSRRGLLRKAQTVIVVMVMIWLNTQADLALQLQIPAAPVLIGAFMLTEIVSILENVQRSGVDLGPLSAVLAVAKQRADTPLPISKPSREA